MNILKTEKRVVVLSSLVEGNSIRSTVRMTGIAKNTVTKLLIKAGAVCSIYQNRIHQTLKVSPAMAADVTDHLWEISDIIKLLENKKSN